MKTRKALTKRFKLTKNGKILRLASGQNHYRAKKRGKYVRQKRKWVALDKAIVKKIKKAGFRIRK